MKRYTLTRDVSSCHVCPHAIPWQKQFAHDTIWGACAARQSDDGLRCDEIRHDELPIPKACPLPDADMPARATDGTVAITCAFCYRVYSVEAALSDHVHHACPYCARDNACNATNRINALEVRCSLGELAAILRQSCAKRRRTMADNELPKPYNVDAHSWGIEITAAGSLLARVEIRDRDVAYCIAAAHVLQSAVKRAIFGLDTAIETGDLGFVRDVRQSLSAALAASKPLESKEDPQV